MEPYQTRERAFYRRQAHRLLTFAERSDDPHTVEVLLRAISYYLDKLEAPAVAAA